MNENNHQKLFYDLLKAMRAICRKEDGNFKREVSVKSLLNLATAFDELEIEQSGIQGPDAVALEAAKQKVAEYLR